MNLFISYPNLGNFYPIQVDLCYHLDHINPKKLQLFEEYKNDHGNARVFIILFRHRQLETLSDRNEITETKLIWELILFGFPSHREKDNT